MAIPVMFKGMEVTHTEYDTKRDEYMLYDNYGTLLYILSRVEFLAQPQLKRLGNSHGKYRRTSSTFHINTAGQSGGAGPSGTYAVGVTGFASFGPSITVGTLSGWTVIPADPPYSSINYTGIRAGEVIAKRCWLALGERLFSVYMYNVEWLPNTPMIGKGLEYGLGVHAFKTDAELLKYGIEICGYSRLGQLPTPPPSCHGYRLVSGTVAMWGEIVEHEFGYRSEFAKIMSIDGSMTEDPFWNKTDERILKMRFGI